MPKVLLVDEQQHMLELLRDKFELEGFEVFTATSGEAGVLLASQLCPDLIVMDERLTDSEGFPLGERLRSLPGMAEVPLILLTARTSAPLASGGVSKLRMPFRPSQLVQLARETL